MFIILKCNKKNGPSQVKLLVGGKEIVLKTVSVDTMKKGDVRSDQVYYTTQREIDSIVMFLNEKIPDDVSVYKVGKNTLDGLIQVPVIGLNTLFGESDPGGYLSLSDFVDSDLDRVKSIAVDNEVSHIKLLHLNGFNLTHELSIVSASQFAEFLNLMKRKYVEGGVVDGVNIGVSFATELFNNEAVYFHSSFLGENPSDKSLPLSLHEISQYDAVLVSDPEVNTEKTNGIKVSPHVHFNSIYGLEGFSKGFPKNPVVIAPQKNIWAESVYEVLRNSLCNRVMFIPSKDNDLNEWIIKKIHEVIDEPLIVSLYGGNKYESGVVHDLTSVISDLQDAEALISVSDVMITGYGSLVDVAQAFDVPTVSFIQDSSLDDFYMYYRNNRSVAESNLNDLKDNIKLAIKELSHHTKKK